MRSAAYTAEPGVSPVTAARSGTPQQPEKPSSVSTVMTASVSASTRRAAVTKGAGSDCVRTAAVIAVMCKPLTLLPAVRTAAKRMPDARLFL